MMEKVVGSMDAIEIQEGLKNVDLGRQREEEEEEEEEKEEEEEDDEQDWLWSLLFFCRHQTL